MKGKDLEEAERRIAAGEAPKRQYSEEENKRWEVFLQAIKSVSYRQGFWFDDVWMSSYREHLTPSNEDSRNWLLNHPLTQKMNEYEAQEPPSPADLKWHEFNDLFSRLCLEWGYHPPNLGPYRKQMTPINEEDRQRLLERLQKKKRPEPGGSPELRQIIGSYFDIRISPADCPWCDERKTFDLMGDTWRCRNCKATGDAADFVMKYENVTRDTAQWMLTKRQG